MTGKPSSGAADGDDRRDRLARALKHNLARRKAQARLRNDTDGTSEQAEPAPQPRGNRRGKDTTG